MVSSLPLSSTKDGEEGAVDIVDMVVAAEPDRPVSSSVSVSRSSPDDKDMADPDLSEARLETGDDIFSAPPGLSIGVE